MEELDMISLLGRTEQAKGLSAFITKALSERDDLLTPMGALVSGPSGCGKTAFVRQVLAELGCETVIYGGSSARIKDDIEGLTGSDTAAKGVLSMFHGAGKPIVALIDEVESLGNGSGKGAMATLVKTVRAKKTKRQAREARPRTPVVCIGQDAQDKSTRELARSCTHIILEKPTTGELSKILSTLIPCLSHMDLANAVRWVDGNLHRLCLLARIARTSNISRVLDCLLDQAPPGDAHGAKRSASEVLAAPCGPDDHARLICESDRTVVGLFLHENIPSALRGLTPLDSLRVYSAVINVICDADCLDRIAFQRQAWQLGELSSIMKTMLIVSILRDSVPLSSMLSLAKSDLRFTRVLTKYSSEYNNARFVEGLCRRTGLGVKGTLTRWYESPEPKDKIIGVTLTPLEAGRLARYTDGAEIF